MNDALQAAWRTKAATIIKQLARRNMTGHYCASASEVPALMRELIAEGSSVTWGGSVTLAEAGVRDELARDAWHLLDRADATTPEQQRDMWRDRASADWMLMSTNAITEAGELVNIDGNGDRLALLVHGPTHVLVVAGMNKVVTDVDAGIKRVRTHACPPNAARLHTNTPCELTGVCAECHGPGCMCCETVITRHSRHTDRIHVVLVGEPLGY